MSIEIGSEMALRGWCCICKEFGVRLHGLFIGLLPCLLARLGFGSAQRSKSLFAYMGIQQGIMHKFIEAGSLTDHV